MPTYPQLPQSTLPQADWFARSHDGLQFAHWVPNVSGGLVVTKLTMQTRWDHRATVEYAGIAEDNGFVAALAQTRWFASYGADHQHEASLAAHLAGESAAHSRRRMKYRRGERRNDADRSVGTVGQPERVLKTSLARQHVVDRAASMEASLDTGSTDNGVTAKLVRLGDLAMQFCDGREPSLHTGDSRLVIEHVVAADAFVRGTPIYRGAYTGLLKNLLDMLPNDALRGKPVGPVATGGERPPLPRSRARAQTGRGVLRRLRRPRVGVPRQPALRRRRVGGRRGTGGLHRLADSVLACATRVPRQLLGGAGLSIARRSLSQS